MLRHVITFELRYQLRSPAFWVTAAVFLLMAFGAAASDRLTIGGKGGNVLVNAPFVIAQTTQIMSLFAMFVAAAFVATSVVRDDETRFGSIIHSTRLPVRDYLLGRFTGAWLAGMVALATVPLGNALGAAMPWLDPETVGPFRADWYLYAWLVLCGPTLLLTSASLFAVALLTRSLAMTYVGVVVLLVGYLVALGLLDEPRFEPIVALLDPFGLAAVAIATKYWTAADRNTLMPALEGALLWNRLLWLGATGLVLAAAMRLYHVSGPRLWRRRRPTENRPQETLEAPASVISPRAVVVPSTRTRHLHALLALIRHDMAAAFRHPSYLVLVLIGGVNAGAALWFATSMYETEMLPVTRVMIQALAGSFAFVPLLIATYYAGELVWSSRDRRMHEILEATPAPDWAFAVPKLIAITLVLISTILGSVLAAVAVQALKGYWTFELPHYVLWYALPWSIDLTLIAVLAVFVQTLVPSKPLGWLVMMGYLLAQSTLSTLGYEHPLYLYGGSTREPLSDMNGQGHFVRDAAWFRLYWSACALLLAVLASALWRRGTVVSFRNRLGRLRLRLAGPAGVLAATALLVMAGVGGWIFYNTNVLNPYRTAEDDRRWRADLERTVAGFSSVPQPRVVDVTLTVDLFPSEGRAVARGRYVIENRTTAPIAEVHVSLPRDLAVSSLQLDGASVAREWLEFNYRILRFATPLSPGARATLHFETRRERRGFRHRAVDTRIVDNGTFLDNSELTPTLGPDREAFLQDRADRRKQGLAPESRLPSLEDDGARVVNVLRRDSDWVTTDITVSTAADQQPIAPGTLVSESVNGARRTARFRSDAPIQHFYSVQSARYAVARDRWQDVDLAVYYHPAHASNVRTMLTAMKASLQLFSTAFRPYQFRQLRVLEFPAYAQFAQSFANTIPYSEGIGFIQHRKDPDDIDGVTYVTAHEVAHQWWGHQLIAARQQGATFLVESLAQYSALRVMADLYGPEQIRRFLKLEMDRYLRARGGERLEELPLARVENQPYIHYQKGGIAMYLLKEVVGAEVVDRALQRLLEAYAFRPAPYPNTTDFLRLLREEAGPAHETLIADLFDRITLYDVKVTSAKSRRVDGGQWETTLDVEARKLYADGTGRETATALNEALEVGVFSAEPGKKGFRRDSVLAVELQSIRDGVQQVVVRSAAAPAFAGVDPYNKRIDRNTDDNVVAVEEGP